MANKFQIQKVRIFLKIYSFTVKHWGDLLFLLVLIYLFLVFKSFLDSIPVFSRNDQGRDFLISHHILQFKEIIATGPWIEGFGGSLHTTPLYYFLLSLFLFINDSFLTLGLTNIIFQLLAITFIYFLARKAFGQAHALVSALLVGVNEFTLANIAYIWNAHMIAPFIYASYLMLFFAYIKHNYRILLGGLIVFTFSIAIHVSAISLLPMYILIAIIILKDRPFRYKIIAFLTPLASLLILFLPTIGYYIKSKEIFLLMKPALVESENLFITNLTDNSASIFFNLSAMSLQHAVLVVTLFCSCSIYYLVHAKVNLQRKLVVVMMLFAIVIQLVSSSLLINSRIYYLIPVYAFVPIIISEVINTIFSHRVSSIFIRVFIIFMLLTITTNNFESIKIRHDLLDNQATLNSTSAILKQEINKIKTQEKFKNMDFFQVKMYSNKETQSSVNDEAIVWALLEKDFKTKFIRLVNSNSVNFELINSDEYIFVICNGYLNISDIEKYCLNNFSKQYPYFFKLRKIYANGSINIYVFRKHKIS